MGNRTLSPTYQAARLRAAAKRSGPRWLQKRIWDWEFKKGQWAYLEGADDPELFAEVQSRLHGGALLDLGCGNGVVRCGLPLDSFSRYVGVDLSGEAIRRLDERTSALPMPTGGQQLITGDFADDAILDQTGGPFSVILLHDAIYYVEDVQRFCRRITDLLTDDGVVIVRIHDRNRYSRFVDAIRESLDVLDERAPADGRQILLVARARLRA